MFAHTFVCLRTRLFAFDAIVSIIWLYIFLVCLDKMANAGPLGSILMDVFVLVRKIIFQCIFFESINQQTPFN